MSKKTFTLKVFRSHSEEGQYWESFDLELTPGLNVISALMEVQKNPVNSAGVRVAPIAWEQGCLEEVCGSCSMLVNGRPRQACTAIIALILKKTNSREVTLAPLTKFVLVRDLVVDRQVMFENLKKVKGWVSADGSFTEGFGPKISQKAQEINYELSTCMTCGCCSEACPQVSANSKFMGPAPVSQVRLFNNHPTGKADKTERLHSMMSEEGVISCGNAQNCVRVCPKDIALTESIAVLGRDITKQSAKEIFGIGDRE
ncbi:succinate dehydrogenase iron-sulfur subunit [Candidatus Aerophobetes bacterium]|uniref:succinate dehydrogenase n=1 Tax=Aerophobetes bacterium TaxID=2030807 RepID=A0A2A4X4P5_UNCAE|nr:MAG: succinate dehydrogenase iron-sulfur subunit [Candidatus Aerophobetes bacterium]